MTNRQYRADIFFKPDFFAIKTTVGGTWSETIDKVEQCRLNNESHIEFIKVYPVSNQDAEFESIMKESM